MAACVRGITEEKFAMSNTEAIIQTEKALGICLMGVFPSIEWETPVNQFFRQHSDSLYWLPWGNRQAGLTLALNWLEHQGLWVKTKQIPKIGTPKEIWQPKSKNIKPLWFFHHNSRTQGGDGKIRFQYAIRCVVLAPLSVSPSAKLSHKLLSEKSTVWFGIEAARSAFRCRESMDFSADFDRLDLTTGTKWQMHEKRDSALLYRDLVVAQHFSHTTIGQCRCPQCRTLT
jgi:hypothetical protein